jgi:hypothetical protein
MQVIHRLSRHPQNATAANCGLPRTPGFSCTNADGNGGFSDSGYTFNYVLENGSSAVAVIAIPEPSTASLLVLTLVLHKRIRRLV